MGTDEISHAASQWGFGLSAGLLLAIILEAGLSHRWKYPVLWSVAPPTKILAALNNSIVDGTRLTSGAQTLELIVRSRLLAVVCLLFMLNAYAPGALGCGRIVTFGSARDAGVWMAFFPAIVAVTMRALELFWKTYACRKWFLFTLLVFPTVCINIAAMSPTYTSDDASIDDRLIGASILGPLACGLGMMILTNEAFGEEQTLEVLSGHWNGVVATNVARFTVTFPSDPQFTHFQVAFAAERAAAPSPVARRRRWWEVLVIPFIYWSLTVVSSQLLFSRRDSSWKTNGDVGLVFLLFVCGPLAQLFLPHVVRLLAFREERAVFRYILEKRPDAFRRVLQHLEQGIDRTPNPTTTWDSDDDDSDDGVDGSTPHSPLRGGAGSVGFHTPPRRGTDDFDVEFKGSPLLNLAVGIRQLPDSTPTIVGSRLQPISVTGSIVTCANDFVRWAFAIAMSLEGTNFPE